MNKEEKQKYNIPHAPPGGNGLYGNADVYNAYEELFIAVHQFMSDVNKDSSFGNLSLGGTEMMAKARAKGLTLKAKNLENVLSAMCFNRK